MRLIICLLVATLSLATSVWSILNGLAGEQFHESSVMFRTLLRQAEHGARRPDAAAVEALEQQVSTVLSWAPTHGGLWLNLELIARIPRELPGGAVVENTPLARQAAEAAVVHAPQSPVAWAEYARLLDLLSAQGQVPDGNARFNSAVRQALKLGPTESSMQLGMLELGLRNWDELEPATMQAIVKALSTFNASRKNVALSVAVRRGRVTELCALDPMRKHDGCASLLQKRHAAVAPKNAADANKVSGHDGR